jgi:GNAT superfamily N-acetyltransferase
MTIQVRAADPADMPALLRMGRAFFSAAPWSSLVEFEFGSLESMIRHLLAAKDTSVLLVAEVDGESVGMAAAVVFPFYFNLRTSCAQEIFWWADPEHRRGVGRALLDGLEAHAKAKGANVFMASALSGLRDEALAKLYQMRGYRPLESAFIKRI